MKLISIIIIIATLFASCKSGRFNLYDLLTEKPSVTELIGIYSLKASDPDASSLIEMGYTDINCRVNLKADGTFSASKLPGCLLHGWDERMYPFTGGIYSISGEWAIIKSGSIYEIKLSITTISEHTLLVIPNPELAAQRKPPTTLGVYLVKGKPIDLGFKVYDGDFLPIQLTRVTNTEEPINVE